MTTGSNGRVGDPSRLTTNLSDPTPHSWEPRGMDRHWGPHPGRGGCPEWLPSAAGRTAPGRLARQRDGSAIRTYQGLRENAGRPGGVHVPLGGGAPAVRYLESESVRWESSEGCRPSRAQTSPHRSRSRATWYAVRWEVSSGRLPGRPDGTDTSRRRSSR